MNRARTERQNPRFFMSLITDPLTERLTFAVPLGRLPKGVRITKPKKHHYLVCDCGARKRFTLFGLADKGQKPETLRGLRRVVCIDVLTWVREHECSVRQNAIHVPRVALEEVRT